MWCQDWSKKSAAHAWIDLVFNEWWTNETGGTNPRGRFETSGFL